MRTLGEAFGACRRQILWMALIAAASLALSFVFACAAPFAALAALASLRLTRRQAAVIVVAGLLANQAIGFGVLDYPSDSLTMAWGAAMAAATLAALFSADAAASFLSNSHGLVRGGASFSVAFLAYEVALYVAALALGGAEAAFAGATIRQVFLIDASSFIGLLALERVLLAIGLSTRPAAVASA